MRVATQCGYGKSLCRFGLYFMAFSGVSASCMFETEIIRTLTLGWQDSTLLNYSKMSRFYICLLTAWNEQEGVVGLM